MPTVTVIVSVPVPTEVGGSVSTLAVVPVPTEVGGSVSTLAVVVITDSVLDSEVVSGSIDEGTSVSMVKRMI